MTYFLEVETHSEGQAHLITPSFCPQFSSPCTDQYGTSKANKDGDAQLYPSCSVLQMPSRQGQQELYQPNLLVMSGQCYLDQNIKKTHKAAKHSDTNQKYQPSGD